MAPCEEETVTRRSRRRAITVIELLVVVVIIATLVALLFPALSAARASSRNVACQSNLKQIGTALMAHADRHGTLCSGAFDWSRDGCVTEIGWVADVVNAGTPAGEMLCPSNPYRISETYNDLLALDATTFDDCVDRLGSPPLTAPDGTPVANPCRAIAETPLVPNTEQRRAFVEQRIYRESYNTNYTATWFLVRSAVLLDSSGNLRATTSPGGAACEQSLRSRGSTIGPLQTARADTTTSLSFLPILGDGAPSGPLVQAMGGEPAGTMVVRSFTRGPVLTEDVAGWGNALEPPVFPDGTPREGPAGWWAGWNVTRQDYRHFAPVHRGGCNILFADGSVRTFFDENDDKLLNNGFPANATTGYDSDEIELPPEEVLSRWSLGSR